MYAQDNNSLPVWSIFCHQLTNSYLHQFSNIFGGNCIRTHFGRNIRKEKGDSKNLIDEFYSHDEDDQTQEESETEEIKESEKEETINNGDGNNSEEQKKLGIDIEMIGARKEELGRT